MALCDQFPHLGHQFVRNVHYGFRRLDASLILGHGVILGLFLVMREYSSHLLFIPTVWKLGIAHCCFFFLRLRNAARGFPIRS
jgi:hypothetical protein